MKKQEHYELLIAAILALYFTLPMALEPFKYQDVPILEHFLVVFYALLVWVWLTFLFGLIIHGMIEILGKL